MQSPFTFSTTTLKLYLMSNYLMWLDISGEIFNINLHTTTATFAAHWVVS